MKHISSTVISQLFLLLIILCIGSLIFFELLPYLSGVLGAITIYVLLRKPMKLLVKRGWNTKWAAILLLSLSVFCIVLPVAGIILMLSNKVGYVVDNAEHIMDSLETQLSSIEQSLGYDLNTNLDTSKISGWISENLQHVAGGTFEVFIAIFIMYFMLYYMLTNRRKLRESLYAYIPISNENLSLIGQDINTMVRSNALGIPLVALAQGLVALIGFYIFGIENPIFYFVLVTVGSMIPFVGGFLGIVPAFILTYANGEVFNAWAILAYGILIVGATDNLIRLFVLKKLDNVHPLITLVGVIIGVPLFGFIGLIFGPLLLSLFLIIIKMYKEQYTPKTEEKLPEPSV